MKRILVVASLLLGLCFLTRTQAHAICSMNGTVSSSSLGIVVGPPNGGDLTFGNWAPNTVYVQGALVIDANGNTQHVTTAGTSGATAPSWSTTMNGTTTDNTATWTLVNIGRASGTSPIIPTQRHYLEIQNTGNTNPMNVAIGSNNNATSKDTLLNPGAVWVLTLQGGAVVPVGDVAAISAAGTTYHFCDY